MGTNYYWYAKSDVCPRCQHGNDVPPLHIGKSSAGWAFALTVHPVRGIHNLMDWVGVLLKEKGEIRDEYGRLETIGCLLDTIVNRSHPAGLRHHEIDGVHVLDRGEGTWDYHVGEFS